MSNADAIQLMLAFGTFTLMLITVVIDLIKNQKK
ncbi:putative holin-like toxin [Xylocopilactobacillus apis]|nr:putative holin-like toxin [Xylocopilactobacillus apis]